MIIGRLTQTLRGAAGPDAIDDRVRKTLVESLYAHSTALLIGNLIGLGCAIITALAWDNRAAHDLTIALAVATLVRFASNIVLPRVPAHRARLAQLMHGIVAFFYAALIGLLAAASIAWRAPVEVQVLTVGLAVGFGIGGAGLKAGYPHIAIGQLVLAILPVAAALAMRGDRVSLATAIFILMTVPAGCKTVAHIFNLLRRSIDAADISAQLAGRMQALATTDVVTGLLNRAGLDQELLDRVASLGPDRQLALLWIDLDRFKEVNDTHGHQAGDRVLAEIGRRLARLVPADAAVARFGGDEFIVACSVDGRPEVEQLVDRLIDSLTAPIRLSGPIEAELLPTGAHKDAGTVAQVSASYGIALMPENGADIDAVLQAADLALYNAKLNGRNQAVFYEPAMTRCVAVRRVLEDELRAAMLREELSIYFQPIIELATGKIRAFEALARWFHPLRGEITPDQFIPLAEESGQIISLGNWITAQAAQVATTWPDDVRLAVNLSPAQIRAPGAALGILAGLRSAGLAPDRLELEITETALLDPNARTDGFIAVLREAGVRFVLDDFGTGYSSLSHISKYDFSRIKVDRSFVSGDDAGNHGDALIRAVAEMARGLGMELTAEGIETVEQAGAMAAMGCTLGQGWHFSRAVPDYLAAMLLIQERDAGAPLRLVG